MRRMTLIRWIGILEIVFLLVPAAAGAQDRVRLPVEGGLDAVAAKPLPEGSLQTASWWQATKTENAPASGAVQQHAVAKRSWPGRHPMLTGALIGFGGGAALGAFGDKDYSTFTRRDMTLIGGGFGAAFGGLAGVVVAIVRR